MKRSTREERLKAIAVADRAIQMVMSFYAIENVPRKPPSPDKGPKLMSMAKAARTA